MMQHGSPSPLPIPQKVGDGQSEAGRGKEGVEGVAARKHKGALQHSQHCQCEAMRLNCRS